jgi:hypothetical protein
MSAWPSTIRFTRPYGTHAKRSASVWFAARSSRYIGYDTLVLTSSPSAVSAANPYMLMELAISFGPAQRNRTSESGSLTPGNRLSSNPFAALKSAVFAPMPSASERMTTSVQPFAWNKTRTAWRRSLRMGMDLRRHDPRPG